jgi:hypothetical protein
MNARVLKISAATKLLPLLLLLSLPAVAQAQNYFTNGLDVWAYTPSTGPVNIYGYSGPGGAVVIPDTIHGSPVTSIGPEVFFTKSSVTGVVIPDTVTSIGNDAFDGCTSLGSLTIPAGVTSIGAGAFAYCSSLTSIVIPNSVTSLGDEAFYDCTGLTGVTIGNSVSGLGDEMFYNCTNLATVNIPNSVADIGDDAFGQCSSLTGVTIGNGVSSIGDEAFEFCGSLTGVTIGNNVASIGDAVFFNCTSLTSVTIPDSVTSIGERAFWGCTSLTGATIGNGITSIGEYAFGECFGLTTVTLGSSVADIGFGAFYICESLSSITFPGSVTNIEGQAFAYCDTLPNVTIPAGVTSIGDGAFFGCFSLTAIDVDGANQNYSSLDGVLFNKNKDTLIQCPGSKEGDYAIPPSVTSIAVEAFYECYLLTTVTVPDGVTSIGEYAFAYCDGLTTFIIPDSVTSLRDNAFTYCDGLTSITIGTGVTSLEPSTFAECYNLMGVHFQGNSPTPTNDLTVFQDDTAGVVYYQSSATGWGTLFDGLPTMASVVTVAVGSVSNIVGNVTVTHPDGSTATLQVGDPIQMGDIVVTPAGGTVHILFVDNTSLQVAQNAKLTIDEYVYDPNSQAGDSSVSIPRGAFAYTSGLIDHNNPDGERLHTGYGYTGIRGTQFIVQQDPCSSIQMVYLIQGELAITPLDTPGVTNICDAPITISVTVSNVTTASLNQATYDSISNQVFQATGTVTFGSWLEQYFDCTNDPAAAPDADPSGDGQDNYTKFLAGMNPTNAASYFHILSATPEGNDELVSWMCGGGRTNVLQTTTNLGGSWSAVSPSIVLAGNGDSVTNYLDVGAVTNTPARFYRVQLVQ